MLRDIEARRLTLHSRTVLMTTGVLLAAGTLLIWLFEAGNPKTLGGLDPASRVLAAFFQSVTPRTSGFSSINTGVYTEAALFVTAALMFIGASPGGTGGGIKTTTFIAPLAVILATVRGSTDPVLFRRRLALPAVNRAVTIALISAAFVGVMATLLTLTERAAFLPALFEATSAFGTVGLSTGLTPGLSDAGRIIVMMTIFAGRVGLLTVVFGLTRRQHIPRVRYPEERLYIG